MTKLKDIYYNLKPDTILCLYNRSFLDCNITVKELSYLTDDGDSYYDILQDVGVEDENYWYYFDGTTVIKVYDPDNKVYEIFKKIIAIRKLQKKLRNECE